MPVTDKTRRALEDLGLTGYEIKAYLALIDFGPAIAADVSSQSGVPYSKIYDVLSNLEKKGWVEIEQSRPSKFYPKSPSTALETMRMKRDSETKQNEEQILSDLTADYEKRGAKERPEIWIVKGEYNILSKVKETLQTCERELMIAVPSGLEDVSEFFMPVLMELRNKGIKVMIMMSEDMGKSILDSVSKWANLRVRETMYGGGLISDAKQVILFLSDEAESGSSLAIWADHFGLARFAKDYFEYLWASSKPSVKV